MEWAPQQQAALDAVRGWLASGERQVFRLFGYAGTGKTTLAREFAGGVDGPVLFGAFTGKAALVLRQKGCWGAQTIHSMIYVPVEVCRARLRELEAKRREATEGSEEAARLDREIEREEEKVQQPAFALNDKSDVCDAELVIIDEGSQTGDIIAEDLLSFGKPLLVLGDPFQLPPVRDSGGFTKEKPDFLLTEVHRQAAESPVLRLATDVREGRGLRLGEYGDSCVIRKGTLSLEELANHDQVIVGTNRLRRILNDQIRREHLGRTSHLPEVGDRLVCLRNNHEIGLLNGGQWSTLHAERVTDDFVNLRLRSLDLDYDVEVLAHTSTFEDRKLAPWMFEEAEHFDFGYAMTGHKAQGSQWDRVAVVDEGHVFRQDAQRWRYTAITRAAESVTVIR